jgi:hypothetical protein
MELITKVAADAGVEEEKEPNPPEPFEFVE